MLSGQFTIDDVESYLNQKLPGFEPRILTDGSRNTHQLRVKTSISFASYAGLSDEAFFPLSPSGRHLQPMIDQFIRDTRQNAIRALGLQEEIDAEVKRTLDRERRGIEERAYRRAMEDAMKKIVNDLIPQPSIDAVLHFIHGDSK